MMGSVRRTVAVGFAVAALAGLGAGVAGAATPAALSSGQQDVRFFNASPYEMFVAKVDGGADPFASIQPGQSYTMTAADLAHAGVTNGQLEVGELDDQADVADIDATSLPPVKLSMHMWDESPSRRFVILDGQRMAEGDRNGEVTVVSIERDGVIVERNGQRARVPLP